VRAEQLFAKQSAARSLATKSCAEYHCPFYQITDKPLHRSGEGAAAWRNQNRLKGGSGPSPRRSDCARRGWPGMAHGRQGLSARKQETKIPLDLLKAICATAGGAQISSPPQAPSASAANKFLPKKSLFRAARLPGKRADARPHPNPLSGRAPSTRALTPSLSPRFGGVSGGGRGVCGGVRSANQLNVTR
jgi:hypothetical protein